MPQPSSNVPTGRFATTLHYLDHSDWRRRARFVAPELGRSPSVRAELRNLVRVLRALRGPEPVVLDSSAGRFNVELLAAAVAGLLPRRRRPPVVMVGEMWDRDPGFRGRVELALVRLAARSVDRFVVYSSEELTAFPATWGIAPSTVRFVPFFSTIEHTAFEAGAGRPGGYVFAGGEPFRDYEVLLDVARALPDVDFVLATSQLADRDDLPANVTAGRVPHAEFLALLAGADAVVTPIRPGLRRAAGQQTYLNAMRSGRPAIVSDSFGVRDHIDDGRTGLIVSGTRDDYVTALRRVLGDGGAVERERLGEAGRAAALHFSFDRHCTELLEVLDALVTSPVHR
ncbi:glycosyltransferase family 4 protein [Pseudonocardia charpentierae]|uniref:Glycosyltransferase family 4 protein n=1 Tax=Pseudonocardia charpentierae TaxID=3075545 RepID=A0ABU2NKI4_9PSEU|nr:glycosyltransferase family 4 protein [Pseudonocardia sp. DSM 45834]MDT0353513.1 glycosyltransferase family 4 protein [Pseudonocardia sp. DSM 45834]